MKLLLAALMLLLTLTFLLSPLYLVWIGIVCKGSLGVKILLVVIGLVLCRLVKPVSIITGKDWEIF